MAPTLRKVTSCCLLAGLLVLALASGVASSASAQPVLPVIEQRQSIPVPTDPDQLSFYLLTVDVGEHVWDNFGHTALRVVDSANGTDLVFNWGLFDTSGGMVPFVWRFMQGIMNYQLGVVPTEWELARYQREQRTAWQERINLTEEQKVRLYRRLAWNLREENRSYSYHYFYDNCTTRVRDYLDEALGGALFEQSRGQVSSTWRDEVRSHYRSLPPVAVGLDVLLNERVDERMTRWEVLFLPLELRQRLQAMDSSVRENGRTLPVLSDTDVLLDFDPPPDRGNGYHYMAGLLVPLGLLSLTIRRIPISSFSSARGYRLAGAGISYRLLGIIGLLLCLFSGLMGSAMVFAWLASSHEVGHANINLLLFWPTDLLLLGYALHWLVAGSSVTTSTHRHQWVVAYLMLHGLAGLVYLLLGITGLVEQRTGALLVYVLPVLLLFAVIVALAGFRSVRPIRFS